MVEQLCGHARYFAERLATEGFHVHNDVVFNQVLVSCGDDRETARTLHHVQAQGDCWCGGSTWKGRTVIRISVCSWATDPEDIDRSVASFRRAREAARRGG